MAMTVTGLDAIVGSHSHTNPATGFGAYKYLPSIVADPDGKPVFISQAYRYNNTLGEIVLGMRAKAGGGYEVGLADRPVPHGGDRRRPRMRRSRRSSTRTSPLLNTYNNTVIGQTTVPIDALQAFTQETNGANLQADAAVFELAKNGITDVDIHLSGAMTNRAVRHGAARTRSPSRCPTCSRSCRTRTRSSTLSMNGPQIKAVLERAYRNYYYYKYVPGYGGYSYYTTCMLDTNFDRAGSPTTTRHPAAYADGNIRRLARASTARRSTSRTPSKYYKVSTVNYLAAGSCNFNDAA